MHVAAEAQKVKLILYFAKSTVLPFSASPASVAVWCAMSRQQSSVCAATRQTLAAQMDASAGEATLHCGAQP